MERTILDRYDAGPDLGLPYPVIVENGVVEAFDPKTGERMTAIRDLDALMATLAVYRVAERARLLPSEIRFVRETLGLQSRQLAGLLGVDKTTWSKIENGRQKLGEATERLLRTLVLERLRDTLPHLTIKAEVILTMGLRAPWRKGAYPIITMTASDGDSIWSEDGIRRTAA